ncbi:TPA: hypothetical protein N2D16_002832 [Clostridium botulinum]|nr:hypothetical protein [Clostridium botulinum]HCL4455208.1 hypothetical protein [Clostridium botulinum]
MNNNLRMLQKRNKNNKFSQTHGMSYSKIYGVHKAMIQRCLNSNDTSYKNYGERGIKVCHEWLDKENGFMNFYKWAISNGYEEGLTIERIDVDGNYEPKNCTWITNKEQQNNKRTNVLITYEGETLNMRQWSNTIGISEKIIENRKRRGWAEKDLLKEKYEGKVNKEMEEKIIKLYKTNKFSARQIGKLVNLSHTTVRFYINKNKEVSK